MNATVLFLLWTLLALEPGPASVQEMAIPVERQYPLFLKILAYDRRLQERVGDEIVIGVVYQARVRPSWLAKNEFMRVAGNSPIKSIRGIPVRAVPIEIEDDPEDLVQAVSEHEVDVLYVSPLRAVDVRKVAEVSRAHKICTLTGVPAYVEAGLAVGIGLRGSRPEILIHLAAAREEGANFNAQLLKLVRVVDT